MTTYQKELAKIINSDPDIYKMISRRGKSFQYNQEFIQPSNYELLEDHWEYPDLKLIDVRPYIGNWIKTNDISQWKPSTNCQTYDRYIITPELLTMLQLKFTR